MNNADKIRECFRIEAKHPDDCTKEEMIFVRDLWKTGMPQKYLDYCDKVGNYVDFDEYFSNI